VTPDETTLLKGLLTTRRVLSVSVLLDGAPYTGLLPFAMQPDFGAALVHASSLARHTAGLAEGKPVSFLAHARDDPDADPLQLPRLTMQGVSRLVARESADYALARQTYIARFPASEPLFEFGDFNLYALVPQTGLRKGL
jgi:putative heme iron utilization protein